MDPRPAKHKHAMRRQNTTSSLHIMTTTSLPYNADATIFYRFHSSSVYQSRVRRFVAAFTQQLLRLITNPDAPCGVPKDRTLWPGVAGVQPCHPVNTTNRVQPATSGPGVCSECTYKDCSVYQPRFEDATACLARPLFL